mmetsp:Transcript_22441/g.63236  ORF Transcript_22441/g.63236 Transcript_22441/m.63236 type:complete len:282 (-) Transcript_22441:2833-3678(-)
MCARWARPCLVWSGSRARGCTVLNVYPTVAVCSDLPPLVVRRAAHSLTTIPLKTPRLRRKSTTPNTTPPPSRTNFRHLTGARLHELGALSERRRRDLLDRGPLFQSNSKTAAPRTRTSARRGTSPVSAPSMYNTAPLLVQRDHHKRAPPRHPPRRAHPHTGRQDITPPTLRDARVLSALPQVMNQPCSTRSSCGTTRVSAGLLTRQPCPQPWPRLLSLYYQRASCQSDASACNPIKRRHFAKCPPRHHSPLEKSGTRPSFHSIVTRPPTIRLTRRPPRVTT